MECKYICKETNDSTLYRMRYQVYVEEKHYMDSKSCNVKDGMVIDELDKEAHIFGVYFENQLVASARYNCTLKGSKLEALDMFQDYLYVLEDIAGKKIEDLNLIEISRIVVKEEFRNTYAIPILFYEIFEHAVNNYNIDGMVFKIRKTETLLERLYLNFNCKIIKNSIKFIKPYGNESGTEFLFGYMLLNDLNLDFNNQKIYKVLKHVGGTSYVERIGKLEDKIKDYLRKDTNKEDCLS